MNEWTKLARRCDEASDPDSELYAETTLSRSYQWDGTTLESSELERDAGAGLRLYRNDRIGFAYANGRRPEASELVDRAESARRLMDPEEHRGLSQSTLRGETDSSWFDGAVRSSPGPRVRAIQDRIDASLGDETVSTLQVSYSEERRKASLFLHGEPIVTQDYTRFRLGVWAVCTDGEAVETGYEHQTAVRFDDLNLSDVIDDAIQRGRRQLGSEPPSSRTGPSLLAARAASGLLRLVRQMLDGEAVVNGRSAWSRERLGTGVGNEHVTVRDHPSLEGGGGNRTFDAEGYRLEPLTLIEEGAYRCCISNDTLNARASLPEVHRASRGYQSRPGVGTTNFHLVPGNSPLDDLLEELGKGPVITAIQPGSGLDPVAGHFSVGAKGYHVRNGQFHRPFTEGTISGELERLLNDVQGVGSRLPRGYATASPPLLVEELSLGGGGSGS